MNLFNKIFGINKANKINCAKTASEVTQENQEKIIGLLNVREEYTTEMFNSIERYTSTRDKLIKKSITEQNNISNAEGIDMINDFIENIAEQIPQGLLIPIKTSFIYKGKAQVLFIGNKMLVAGKSLKANATRPRQTLKEKEFVGFLLDFDEELNLFDPNNNSKIYFSKEKRPKIINLIHEQLIDTKTVNCRVANLELIFTNWEESLDSVVKVDNNELINELLEHLVCLDYEVTTGVTDFLNKKAKAHEEELQKQREANEIINSSVIRGELQTKDNSSNVDDRCHCEECHCDNNQQESGSSPAIEPALDDHLADCDCGE